MIDESFSLDGMKRVAQALRQKHQIQRYLLLLLWAIFFVIFSIEFSLLLSRSFGYFHPIESRLLSGQNVFRRASLSLVVVLFGLVCGREFISEYYKDKIQSLKTYYGYNFHQDEICTIFNENESTQGLSAFLMDNLMIKDIIEFVWQTSLVELKRQVLDLDKILDKRAELIQCLFTQYSSLMPPKGTVPENHLGRLRHYWRQFRLESSQAKKIIDSLPVLMHKITHIIQSPSESASKRDTSCVGSSALIPPFMSLIHQGNVQNETSFTTERSSFSYCGGAFIDV